MGAFLCRTGAGQTCTNSIFLSGGAIGLSDTGTLTVTNTNTGTISGTSAGIQAITANVSNFGTISGTSFAIQATTANVSNFGTISGTRGIQSTNANVSNSGAISGTGNGGTNGFGIVASNIANVSNSGIISGTGNGPGGFGFGIDAGTVNATNFGTISGTGAGGLGFGIQASTANLSNFGTISGTSVSAFAAGMQVTTANVSNFGTISGTSGNFHGIAIQANTANVSNSGTISGTGASGGWGLAVTTANVTNFGTISGTATQAGGIGFGIEATTGNLTNAGTIFGTTAALQFGGNADTLTLLPGSRIIGAINLGGGGDTVNVKASNQNLTFDTLADATVTGTVPFVVSGNRIASVDPTPFGLADKILMDFTRAVSSILGSLGETTSVSSGPAATAFAPESGSNRIGDAFASIPGLAYAANDHMAFKNPTMVYSDGRSVWARGFTGERFQQADDTSVRARNLFEGGAIGADLLARPDLRFGIFAGGGHNELSLDLNAGNTKTDTAFGGIYGRYSFASFGAASFLDFALHGGGSTNGTSRNINNNLLAGGLETATASYNSSYVSPELTYGVKLPLWAGYTLTPSIGLRYVAGTFGGYTETGSTANLTVASRTIQDFEQRGELKLTHITAFTPKDALLTSVNVGVLGIERLGDTTVNTVLLGQGLPLVTPGKNSVAGVFGGLGMEWRTRSGVSFFSAAEYTAMSDQANTIVGRGGIRVAF